MKNAALFLLVLLSMIMETSVRAQAILLKHITLIDGNGGVPRANMDILIQSDTIAAIRKNILSAGARTIDLTGKTVMPALISSHSHVGTLKGTRTDGTNYTRENILRQLTQYETYGVGGVLVMGTDRPLIFNGFRDSAQAGLLPGARLYSAGYGFGVPGAAPPAKFGMDQVFRPSSPAEVPQQMEELAKLRPTVVKMWVDDFGGTMEKMKPEIYDAIIREAHSHGLRVASHIYYLEDARRLVKDGVDIIAHSIRDKDIDDALLKEMKNKGVVYIPTLSLDEYAYIYSRRPDWIDDAFFKASLEPGVYEMITSEDYQAKIKNDPAFQRNTAAFETALRNLKKIFGAGVLVSMGTDSGAIPIRAQGFSEHLELELMVQAGLTPLQAITVATRNASVVLRISDHYGTLENGKKADFIVMSESPEKNIKNTRKIEAVWKNGLEVNHGPLAQ